MSKDSGHIFGVKCHECGHVSYFDKREVCGSSGIVPRRDDEGTDTLQLKCAGCGAELVVQVDCEGY